MEDLNDFKPVATDGPALPHPSALSLRSASPTSTPEGGERVNATIVIVLTLACTGLSVFDLFLLASGA